MNINEIFLSINGETTTSGEPTIFIRTFGCNLKCKYCDTIQDTNDCKDMSLSQICREVDKLTVTKNINICITGGEPMLRPELTLDLIQDLNIRGYNNIQVETNGSIELFRKHNNINNFKYIMDIKCPSSGEEDNNRYINLSNLTSEDEVKFVIADKTDFNFAMAVLTRFPTRAKVLLSPMFDETNKCHIGKDLVDWALDFPILKFYRWRVQVQLHKILGEGVK